MEKLRQALGLVLRERRKAERLSQEALAERLDLHRNYISLIERGVQNITLETLFKLSDALHCYPSALLAEVEEMADARGFPENYWFAGRRDQDRKPRGKYDDSRMPSLDDGVAEGKTGYNRKPRR